MPIFHLTMYSHCFGGRCFHLLAYEGDAKQHEEEKQHKTSIIFREKGQDNKLHPTFCPSDLGQSTRIERVTKIIFCQYFEGRRYCCFVVSYRRVQDYALQQLGASFQFGADGISNSSVLCSRLNSGGCVVQQFKRQHPCSPHPVFS